MGFSFLPSAPVTSRDKDLKGISPEFLASQGCKVCPLRDEPKVGPSGTNEPVYYVLADAPGKTEVQDNKAFRGEPFRKLRDTLPQGVLEQLRFNNTVLHRPPKSRKPTAVERACCRPYIVEDIERTQPFIILGLGAAALEFVTGETGITNWAGRYCPVRIGSHTCWFFANVHPAYALYEAEQREQAELLVQFEQTMATLFAIAPTLPDPEVHSASDARRDVHVELSDVNRIVNFLDMACRAEQAGFDIETKHLRPYHIDSKILTAAVSLPHATLAFPVQHRGSTFSAQQTQRIVDALKRFIMSPCRKLVHNAAFELEWAIVKLLGPIAARMYKWGCSQSQAYILDTRPRTHSLDFQCYQHFGIALKSIGDLDKDHLDEADVSEVCRYNGVDAKYHRLLYDVLAAKIEANGLLEVYKHHVERIGALVKTQVRGLTIDKAVNNAFFLQYDKQKKQVLREIHALPEARVFQINNKKARAYNPGSVKDMRQLLGYKLGPKKMKELEEVAMDIEHLKAFNIPIADLTLKYRHATKMLSTYIEGLMPSSPAVYPDGKLHPILSSMRVRTWRTSGEDPNMQNWPKRGEGVELRKQIVPSKGHTFVAVDYSGIQARNVAMESRDKTLVQAYIDHYDIHTDWAHRIHSYYKKFGNPDDPKSFKDMRNRAKNKMVFPLFFGAQAGTIGHYLEVPERVGFKLYDDFWGMFPDVRVWHNKLRRSYRKNGYVSGHSKFRRYGPINENMMINSPIQSDEALLVLEAMCRLAEYEDPNLQPVLEIHDDLTFEVETAKLDEYIDIILTEMLRITHTWINVPLGCEVSISDKSWLDIKEVGKYESDPEQPYIQI